MTETLAYVLAAQTGWAVLTLRFVLGVIFLLHGWRKASQFRGASSWFAGIGLRPGILWASIVTALELAGGALLLVGLATQMVSLILACVMVGAALVNLKTKQPFFRVLELDLIILASLLLLATLGGGFFSLL